MAQSTVYSNIVTPSCKGMRCTARTKNIRTTTRILHDRFLISDVRATDSLLILTLADLNLNGNYLYIGRVLMVEQKKNLERFT